MGQVKGKALLVPLKSQDCFFPLTCSKKDKIFSFHKDIDYSSLCSCLDQWIVENNTMSESQYDEFVKSKVGNKKISIAALKQEQGEKIDFNFGIVETSINEKFILLQLGSYIDLPRAICGEKLPSSFPEKIDIPSMGDLIFTSDENGILKTYHSTTQNCLKDWGKVHKSVITALALSRDSQYMFTGTQMGSCKQWILKTAMLYHKFGFIHEGSVENIIVSSDGQWLLTIGSDRRLKQWGIGDNRRIRIQTQTEPQSGRSLINEKDNKSMRGINERTNSKPGWGFKKKTTKKKDQIYY